MVRPEDRYPIQSICTVAHAVLGILLWLLEQHAGLSDKWTNGRQWYYAVYLLVVPYLAIGAVFIFSMHYPESTLGRAVRMKPLVVGILTFCFYVAGRACIMVSNISINGNAKSTDSNCKCTHGSTLSSMNLGVNLLVLSISKYISEGYIQKYIVTRNLAAESHQWPTDGMSTIQAFHYWLQVGWQEGLKNFKGTFDQDVREKLAHALLTND
ncbi:Tpr-related family member protein, putative [Babesia ovis]|uniref:Tpr-related family member protein, putative n=1 Tax=Babesia ovis TaxID=5869 RepID=A0A9W5TD90_BABOV|nr:Tpr-related family member protein, putative [Babesia ovis]